MAAFRHRVIQEREDRYQFRCRLDIQVVHAHGGDDALRIVLDGLAQFSQREKDSHPVVIEVGAGFQ